MINHILKKRNSSEVCHGLQVCRPKVGGKESLSINVMTNILLTATLGEVDAGAAPP